MSSKGPAGGNAAQQHRQGTQKYISERPRDENARYPMSANAKSEQYDIMSSLTSEVVLGFKPKRQGSHKSSEHQRLRHYSVDIAISTSSSFLPFMVYGKYPLELTISEQTVRNLNCHEQGHTKTVAQY